MSLPGFRIIVIYSCFKFHEIPFADYLVMANYLEFKSIQGL